MCKTELKKAFSLKVPFAIYRMPESEKLHVIIQKDNTLYNFESFSDNGFIFMPFKKNKKGYIIPVSLSTYKTYAVEDLKSNKDFTKYRFSYCDENISKLEYTDQLKRVIEKIKSTNGDLEKVVWSRKESYLSHNLDLIEVYKNLLALYPNAFVSMFYNDKVGVWMCASPEVLLTVKESNFTTMALAGTQLYKEKKEVSWREKELLEHKFVTDYILNQLESVGVKRQSLFISKPYNFKAGLLLHICTSIRGKIKNHNNWVKVIDALHPTPAVCGVSKEDSYSYITQKEGYDRCFYTGYLGPLGIGDQTSFYVNLRCMEFKSNKVSLYVGGGITKDSKPYEEWEETVFKCRVLKNALGIVN